MIINQPGTYLALQDIVTRGTVSVAILPAGLVFTISQIDSMGNKVIGPALEDWIHWDLPVEPFAAAKEEKP